MFKPLRHERMATTARARCMAFGQRDVPGRACGLRFARFDRRIAVDTKQTQVTIKS
jgi:hypothetical protein